MCYCKINCLEVDTLFHFIVYPFLVVSAYLYLCAYEDKSLQAAHKK